jgi:hypothetical protein
MTDYAPIIQLAKQSPIYSYQWGDKKAAAPQGYIKGMAVAFAEAYKRLKEADPVLQSITRPRAQDPDHDILDWYAQELAQAGAASDTPASRLIAAFTVMIGLGIRESSGRLCCGPDTPEDRGPPGHPVPTTPENAEAGLFQISYDSIQKLPDRQALVDAFAGRTDLQDIFAEGTRCGEPHDWPDVVGTGAPAAFQKLAKECPLFATLYSGLLMRQMYKEWGPLIRKKAIADPDAVVLFGQIRDLVDRG